MNMIYITVDGESTERMLLIENAKALQHYINDNNNYGTTSKGYEIKHFYRNTTNNSYYWKQNGVYVTYVTNSVELSLEDIQNFIDKILIDVRYDQTFTFTTNFSAAEQVIFYSGIGIRNYSIPYDSKEKGYVVEAYINNDDDYYNIITILLSDETTKESIGTTTSGFEVFYNNDDSWHNYYWNFAKNIVVKFSSKDELSLSHIETNIMNNMTIVPRVKDILLEMDEGPVSSVLFLADSDIISADMMNATEEEVLININLFTEELYGELSFVKYGYTEGNSIGTTTNGIEVYEYSSSEYEYSWMINEELVAKLKLSDSGTGETSQLLLSFMDNLLSNMTVEVREDNGENSDSLRVDFDDPSFLYSLSVNSPEMFNITTIHDLGHEYPETYAQVRLTDEYGEEEINLTISNDTEAYNTENEYDSVGMTDDYREVFMKYDEESGNEIYLWMHTDMMWMQMTFTRSHHYEEVIAFINSIEIETRY